jgi:putative endonuclease
MNDLTVYIVTNSRHTVLYIGVTNDLLRRLREHQLGQHRGFTSKYQCAKLLWCELFRSPLHAIECEKRLKGWTRAKKEKLIGEMHPEWRDLGLEMFGERLAPLPTAASATGSFTGWKPAQDDSEKEGAGK